MNKTPGSKKGRKPITTEKKTEMFAFLLTPSEKKAFLAYAGQRSVSETLRDLIRPVLQREAA